MGDCGINRVSPMITTSPSRPAPSLGSLVSCQHYTAPFGVQRMDPPVSEGQGVGRVTSGPERPPTCRGCVQPRLQSETQALVKIGESDSTPSGLFFWTVLDPPRRSSNFPCLLVPSSWTRSVVSRGTRKTLPLLFLLPRPSSSVFFRP